MLFVGGEIRQADVFFEQLTDKIENLFSLFTALLATYAAGGGVQSAS
jgi:hypothetical protein